MSTFLVDLVIRKFKAEAIKDICGCSLMVEPQPSKLTTWVRFPSSAPFEIIIELVIVRFFYYIPRIHLTTLNIFAILYTGDNNVKERTIRTR